MDKFVVTFCHNCDGGMQEFNTAKESILTVFPDAEVEADRRDEYPIWVRSNQCSFCDASNSHSFNLFGHLGKWQLVGRLFGGRNFVSHIVCDFVVDAKSLRLKFTELHVSKPASPALMQQSQEDLMFQDRS